MSKSDEHYNLFEIILLGFICTNTIITITSFWIPTNSNLLFIFTIASVIYLLTCRKGIIQNLSDSIYNISKKQIAISICFIALITVNTSWISDNYDSLFYHYQHINWNESYHVVPGLANLEDRFGFNSSYLLISALYSFSWILTEAIYPINNFFLIVLGLWIFNEVYKSNFERKRCIILLFFVIYYLLDFSSYHNTSTDILPNLITFYIICLIALYPEEYPKKQLFLIIVPIYAITCKLSTIPFCLITLFIIIHLFKKKEYPTLRYITTTLLLIIVPWIIRNIVISGYLAYPVTGLDIFHFDWEVPHAITTEQKEYIHAFGYKSFKLIINLFKNLATLQYKFNIEYIYSIIGGIIYIISAAIIVIYTYQLTRLIKAKQAINLTITVKVAIIFTIIIWYTNGPDIRFIKAILLAAPMLSLISSRVRPYKKSTQLAYLSFTALFVISTILTSKRYEYYNNIINQAASANTSSYNMINTLYKPYSIRQQLVAQGVKIDSLYQTLHLNNNIEIYLTNPIIFDYITYSPLLDKINSTTPTELSKAKFSDYRDIEARGKSLQDGFRVKRDSLYKYQ